MTVPRAGPASAAGAAGHRAWIAPAAILLAATILRVAWPALTEFKFSEARLAALALELTREGHVPLVGVPSSAGLDHSPLSVYLYLPPFLLSADPIPATIYGGLVNVGAVALCWWLARRWPGGGPAAALVAVLLLAVNPWAVAFSRKIWQVAFVPILALACLGLLVSVLVRGRQWALAWALGLYAVLVQVHPSAVSLAPVWLLWLVVFRRQLRIGPLLAGTALGALSAIPFALHQIQAGWPALTALRSLPAARWDLATLDLAWEAITGRGLHALAGEAASQVRLVPEIGWTLQLTGWLLVASGLALAWRIGRNWRTAARGESEVARAARTDLILLSWLVVPVLFNLRHTLDLHLHFFALIIPAACLIVGRAAAVVWSSARALWGRVGLATVLGYLVAGQVAVLLLMAQFVATHATPGGFGIPLSHYSHIADRAVALADGHEAAEILVVGQGSSPVVDETPAIFDVLLRGRGARRFVDGRSSALFPMHRAVALLAPGAGQGSGYYEAGPVPDSAAGLPDGYRLALLDGSGPPGRDALTPIQGPRLFANGVEFQAYSASGEAVPGGRLTVWLLWQVLWTAPQDTHFFIHLLDGADRQVGQQDNEGYPTAGRLKGDRVISQFDITIPVDAPSPPYWAAAGLYRYPDIVNVAAIDGAGNPIGETVRLGPFGGGP